MALEYSHQGALLYVVCSLEIKFVIAGCIPKSPFSISCILVAQEAAL